MRLSNKVLIILGIVWGAFLIISYIATEHFLLQSFLRLENNQINTNINRVKKALDQVSYALSTFTVDWAHWNDAYEYLNGSNPQFVPNNIDFSSLINSNLNMLIYLNKQGDVKIGIPIDIEKKQQVAFPAGLDKYIYPGSILEHFVDTKSSIRGFISLPSGIMLIASAGVSYTDLSKPINGTAIAARYFSQNLLQKIADATSLSLALYTSKAIRKDPQVFKLYKKSLANKNGEYILIKNKNLAYGYTVLYDIFNQPIGMLQVKTTREIYLVGKKAINFYLSIFFISGLVLAIIIWYLLRILVLNRLEYLNDKIKEINKKKDYRSHIIMKEKDELSSVAKHFNSLMDTINISHEQLKRQVKEITSSEKKLESANTKLILEIQERKQIQQKIEVLHKKLILAARRAGMADIASGILHNVGNILNNVTISIGITKEMLERSRSQKMQDLADLLKENKDNIEVFFKKNINGVTIIEYVELLAKQLLIDNKAIEEELANLDKNICHIKDAILMQKSLSSVVGMNEKVKISDVIEDALTLNKAISENKNIAFVCDYQFNNTVILDRVKLLHVLVNLIKNSIEALLESDVLNKKIIIRVQKKEKEFFTIEISDNGIGILVENLKNIFTYGFTTKKNGNGIGLHTSAIFIKEMGGELSVENEGMGKGATFILQLPTEFLTNEDNNTLE